MIGFELGGASELPERAWAVGLFEEHAGLTNEFGMCGGEVLFLAKIFIQIVDLNATIELLMDVHLNRLPVVESNRSAATTFVEFPVKIVVLGLLVCIASKFVDHRNSVQALRRLDSRKFAEGGKHVPVSREVFGGGIGPNLLGPAYDQWDADAPFVEVSFVAA